MMWYNIFKFEIAYRIRRPDTYVFFIFLFLFSIVGVDFIFQGAELGGIKKNAPLVIAKTMGANTGIFMILASMIMGVSVLRDFEYQMESLMFVNPITKKDYLLGRFLGSFSILLFVFSSIFFGMIIGEFMPWQDPKDLLYFDLLAYLQSFISISLPILFFGASLFFVSGALSRNLAVVYTQGIILFVVFMLTKAISNEYLQALLDPFSLTTLSLVTESWTTLETNSQLIPFNGVLFYNKLVWLSLGVLTLVFGYKKFDFNVIKSKRFKSKKQQPVAIQEVANQNNAIPEVQAQQGFTLKWNQLMHFSWFYFKSICKQASFWAIVICGMIIILINSVNLGTVYGVDSYPATYFIVEELQQTSIYFFIIILVFYSGELIWKERSAKLDLICDATPVSSFINLLGKYIGLLLIYVVLMISLIVSGIIFQSISGYYNYELQVYLYGFFLEIFPFLALYTFIAFFIQAITNHKFIGVLLVLMFFICNVALGLFGFDHDLYFFGGDALASYSDMNGYGHFLRPYLFIKTYWFLFGMILLVVASLFLTRGTETNFLKRLEASSSRLSISLLKFTSVLILAFILLGGYIFYNTNVVNEYWTNSEATQFRVDYEKTLKQFEYIPQPKIVAVNLKVDLYPSKRDYTVEGYYLLKNTNETAIEEIHIQKLIEANIKLENVIFEAGARLDTQYNKYDYSIYKLNESLQSGATIKMDFKQTFTTRGFEESGSNENIVENGIFFNNKDLPTIGYNRKYELSDNEERADYKLAERFIKEGRDHPNEVLNARSGSDSDGIDFEMVIGTAKDQTAIVPGELLKQWQERDRNYFHYKMKQPIIDFYSIISARYELKKDTWQPKSDPISQPVDLEIYYHKGHEYNLDRMMAGMKASLDYYSKNFSPYQYQQLRIMEFPRYAEFAQSFPGTIPFSESIGFILDIDDEKDIDMAFYVTAHEVAHQWFGLQVEAANVQGQHFILESLSQFAAIMVLKQHFPDKKVQQFLELQEEKYREGQRKEASQEPALALVENQDYVYYAKGAIAMYRLQENIGEDKVNLALKRFLEDWNTIDGKLKTKTKRYATSKDLLQYFRDVTPDSQQHLIKDLFESVK